ncbi:MAG: hypothetical protein P8Y27_03960 [Chromatiaceae bacterium]
MRHQRDVSRYYRSDSAAALAAGNDVRKALVAVGVGASHGYKRMHLAALQSLARLVTIYMQSPPLYPRDRQDMGGRAGFPTMQAPASRHPGRTSNGRSSLAPTRLLSPCSRWSLRE